jgi:hypothetical protein
LCWTIQPPKSIRKRCKPISLSVILEGNDINDELASFDGVDYEMVDSDDESYDPANPNTYEDYF